ncbi:hypothetical protein [Clostridium sp.]|jgi:hypothetical protein|uniref:hypothetical protein n=1 Tax=Clostridium sp. TaxID=1506 RepID=UPI002FDD5065
MLKLHWIELFLRGIPEMFLVIWGISIICKTYFSLKKYVFLGIVMSILTFLIRSLPIYFGVHTIIIITMDVIIMIIAGMPIVSSIYGTLVMFLSLSLSEFLNMLLLDFVGINSTITPTDSIKKCILGIPSLVILFLIVIILNYVITRREKFKDVSN